MRVRTAASEVAPTGSNTVTLFDSFVAFMGMPNDTHELVRHTVLVKNSQAGTLRLAVSSDGSTWNVIQSVAVAIPSAPATASGPYDFAIDGLKFHQVLWVNGGVDQDATWRCSQELTEKVRAAQT